jgi:hypothetical protein
MNIQHIIEKSDHSTLSIYESLFLIEQYVKERKGVEIKARIETNLGSFREDVELRLMNIFVNYAINYFKTNL